MELIGQGIMPIISLQMMARRVLIDPVTELEDKVRPIKPSNVCQKALHNKWVYIIKNDNNDSKCYKAKLVVKGFQQKKSIDYSKIFLQL